MDIIGIVLNGVLSLILIGLIFVEHYQWCKEKTSWDLRKNVPHNGDAL